MLGIGDPRARHRGAEAILHHFRKLTQSVFRQFMDLLLQPSGPAIDPSSSSELTIGTLLR